MYPSSIGRFGHDLDVDGNVYANNISSDERLKNNIEDTRTNATENLNKFKIKSFNWKKIILISKLDLLLNNLKK